MAIAGKASRAKARKTTRKKRRTAPAGQRHKQHLVAEKQGQSDRYLNELKEARDRQAATAEPRPGLSREFWPRACLCRLSLPRPFALFTEPKIVRVLLFEQTARTATCFRLCTQ